MRIIRGYLLLRVEGGLDELMYTRHVKHQKKCHKVIVPITVLGSEDTVDKTNFDLQLLELTFKLGGSRQ